MSPERAAEAQRKVERTVDLALRAAGLRAERDELSAKVARVEDVARFPRITTTAGGTQLVYVHHHDIRAALADPAGAAQGQGGGVGTGAGGASDPAQTEATDRVNRSVDCPEAPAQAHSSTRQASCGARVCSVDYTHGPHEHADGWITHLEKRVLAPPPVPGLSVVADDGTVLACSPEGVTGRDWVMSLIHENAAQAKQLDDVRAALIPVESLLSLLHHRGLVDSEHNREDVKAALDVIRDLTGPETKDSP